MDKKKTVYLIFASVLFIMGIVSLINSKYFELRTITVLGNKMLSDQEVIDFCELTDSNIFKIDRHYLANKLLELPQIKGVAINRDLPDKLIIKINERRPVAIVGIESSYQIIDIGGWILGTTKNLAYWDLPLITGVKVLTNKRKVEIGKELEIAINYLAALSNSILQDISELNISKDEGIYLILVDGGVVKLGNKIDIKKNAYVFTSIYNDLKEKKRNIKYIDLRYKGNPVVKLKK